MLQCVRERNGGTVGPAKIDGVIWMHSEMIHVLDIWCWSKETGEIWDLLYRSRLKKTEAYLS